MNLPMMLVARGPDDGDWVALSIYGPGERIEIQEGYWRGLTDDPKDRLPEWKLLSEEDK